MSYEMDRMTERAQERVVNEARADWRRRFDDGGQCGATTIVRRDNGESYREMLTQMAKESGIDTPSAEDMARFDRKRKGKTLRHRGPESGLRQPGAAEIRDRTRDHAQTRRIGRTLLPLCPRSRRHAPPLAVRTREHSQALPDSCRRIQSRRPDAAPSMVRERRGKQQRPAPLSFSSCKPTPPWHSA